MALISAFIGRSFDEKDEPLWGGIRKFLDSPQNTLFSWEDAEQSQASSVSAKVKAKIEKNDIFIGILTKRDPICRKYFYLWKKYLLAESANYLTSYWVIQECGYALGKGKKVVFMIEKGLDIPGGLNADAEYIALDPYNLSTTFTKLNEIISNEISAKIKIHEEIPSLKSGEIISVQKSEIQEKEERLEAKPVGWNEVMSAIKQRNYSPAEELFNKMLSEDEFREEEIKTIAKIFYYRELYLSGKNEAFDQLKEIADGNLEDDFGIQRLADCLVFYDKYKDAKGILQAYMAKISNNAVKFRLSIRLSAINIKLKEFEGAKENLYPFFANLASNSNEYNSDVYKALGDVYKEEGQLDKSCSLYEMALYYQPTDLDLRFRLAYDYAQIKKHPLSTYHYKKYLKSYQDPTVMNNLGAEYQGLSLQGRAVTCYKRAVEKKNTLASANLASKYIGTGFFEEAKVILNQAMGEEGHHENVEFYLNHLNTQAEKEEKEEESLLKGAKEHREYILEFAQAISVRFDNCEEIKGLWRTGYKDIKEFRIELVSPNVLSGEHEIEEAYRFAIPPPLFSVCLQTFLDTFAENEFAR